MDQNQSMQFDQAELDKEVSQKFECSFCQAPLVSSYFELNGQPACEACRYKVEAEMAESPGMSGFFKAAMAGLGAALVGAGIYYAVLALSGYEVGLVAILVGFLVGRAVHWGSKGRGGRAYQALAVFLTYFAIVGTYIPLIIEESMKAKPAETEQAAASGQPAAAGQQAGAETGAEELGVGGFFLAIGLLLLLAAAIPFLAGIENILGIVVIAVGLYEAWRINKRAILDVSGPFQVGKLVAPRPEPAA